MITVRRTTPLPIGAETAFGLALKPATFAYVARGVLRVPALATVDGDFSAPGAQARGRLWWLGVLPTWTHHLRVVAIEPGREVRTAEHGGPVRTWNHRLTFTPTSPAGCEYTDEIEIDAGPLTPLVAVFARTFFALRQARWRRLAAVLS
ncbi:MAG TPA: hypothetical protein VFG42_10910 [Baekduia sp.]|uniref:hypothetical protein n=1 Tax=Baekduia sp. TaxID=2600305 RepID=UPI002D7A0AC8|nr:hypothetical protein [Baekduia sp.]HET6507289.1 hypothetical protein [Baekduia sp.]